MSKENLSNQSTSGLHLVGQELMALVRKIESDPENQRINPSDFVDHTARISGREVNLFPAAEVRADMERVAQWQKTLTAKYEEEEVVVQETGAKAALIESMLPQLVKELSWLGDRVKVINSSLYDDYFNKIDGAIQLLPDREIRDEKDIRCVGFSTDFTLSAEEARKKIFEQAVFLCQGRLPRMKYFRTDIETSAGPKTIKLKDFKMPRVILACSGKVVDDSIDDFAAYEHNQEDVAVRERLDNGDLKFYFIREIVAQLDFFVKLTQKFIEAERSGGNDTVLLDRYQRIIDMYSTAYRELLDIISGLGYDLESVREKTKSIPSPTDRFDLNTATGNQLLEIVKTMAKQK